MHVYHINNNIYTGDNGQKAMICCDNKNCEVWLHFKCLRKKDYDYKYIVAANNNNNSNIDSSSNTEDSDVESESEIYSYICYQLL